jgi:hypothetical protein
VAEVQIRFVGNASSAVAASRETAVGLGEVSKSASATTASLGRVGEASKLSNAALIEQTAVVGRATKAHEQHTQALGRSERGALAATGAFGGLGRSMVFASNAFLGGALIVGSLKGIIDATKNAQVAQEQLASAFKNSGLSWAANREQVAATEASMRKLGFTDTETMTALARLIVTTKDAGLAHKDLALAADLARFRHISLADATQLVIRASEGMVGSLRRLGIDVKAVTTNVDALKLAHERAAAAAKAHGEKIAPLTKAQLDAAKAADKHATSLAALALLHKTTADAAERYSHTAAGAVLRLKASADELAVSLGKSLLPAISGVLDKLAQWVDKLTKSKKVHDDIKTAVHDLVGAFKALEPIVVSIAKQLNDVVKAIDGWKTAFELIISLYLANKFLKLAEVIRASRVAFVLLGDTAPVAAGKVVAGEAAMTAGADTFLGRLALVTAGLRNLAAFGAAGIVIYLEYKAIQGLLHDTSKSWQVPSANKWVGGGGTVTRDSQGNFWFQQGGAGRAVSITAAQANAQTGGQADPLAGVTSGGTPSQGGPGGHGYTAPKPKPATTPTPAPYTTPTSFPVTGTTGRGSRKSKALNLNATGQIHGSAIPYIVASAKKYNVDPEAALAVATQEGGLNLPAQIGDNGTSFGPFQLHMGGELPSGLTAADAQIWANSPAGIDYALRQMAAAGAAGVTGAGAAGVIVRQFERPAKPGPEAARAEARYGSIPLTGAAGTIGLGGSSLTSYQTFGQQLGTLKASFAKDIGDLNTLVGEHALSSSVVAGLRARAAAVRAELEHATKADITKVRGDLSNLQKAIQEGVAQATDVTKIRGMIASLHDELKNNLISPEIEKPIEARLKHLEQLLRDHLLSPAQRKLLEAQIKTAGAAITEALKQALDVQGIDTFIKDWATKIRDALGIGIKQLVTPQQIEILANRIHQIHDLLAHGLLSDAERKRLEAELKQDEGTLGQGLDGLISQIADAKSAFDTAWADFKQHILDAFNAIPNPYTAAETFAQQQMAHQTAVRNLATGQGAVDTAVATGDPDALRGSKLLHSLATAWTAYYDAVTSGDPDRISKATQAVTDAQGAWDTFTTDPGLSTAGQTVATNGDKVIQALTTLGDETLTTLKNNWDAAHKQNAQAISDFLDDMAKRIRDGKETPQQAWSELVAFLVAHGFTPDQAAQMAGPMIDGMSNIGGAIHDLITAIGNLTLALEALAGPNSPIKKAADTANKNVPSKETIQAWDNYWAHVAGPGVVPSGTPPAGPVTSPGQQPPGSGPGGDNSPHYNLIPAPPPAPPAPLPSAGKILQQVAIASAGGSCFVAGTPVATPDGERPIEQLEVGDEVLVWDFRQACQLPSTVSKVERHEDGLRRALFELDVEGVTLATTPEHPFWTGKKWLAAGAVREGDRVACVEDGGLRLRTVRLVKPSLEERAPVFNLHVEHTDHNYFAGGCLVHNMKAFGRGGPVPGQDRGFDSVPALLRPQEYVLNHPDIEALGGLNAVDALMKNLRSRRSGAGPALGSIAALPRVPAIASLPSSSTPIQDASLQRAGIGKIELHVHGTVIHERDLAVTVRDAMIHTIGNWNRNIFGGMA